MASQETEAHVRLTIEADHETIAQLREAILEGGLGTASEPRQIKPHDSLRHGNPETIATIVTIISGAVSLVDFTMKVIDRLKDGKTVRISNDRMSKTLEPRDVASGEAQDLIDSLTKEQ